jgi:hypothetical protein
MKLQKFEDFSGMNARKLLEVPRIVFVNCDQEVKMKADRKMKRR